MKPNAKACDWGITEANDECIIHGMSDLRFLHWNFGDFCFVNLKEVL